MYIAQYTIRTLSLQMESLKFDTLRERKGVAKYEIHSIQISGILLKLKGYDEKLGDLSKIGNNENNISSNLGKIDTNKNSIDEINENLSNIDFNSNNKYSIENFFIYDIEIENSYKVNEDKPSFSIFKYTLEDDF